MKRSLILAVAVVCACSSRPAPPSADTEQRPFPDISGRSVLLLPVQANVPVIGVSESGDSTRSLTPLTAAERLALEAELGFWLAELAPRVRWVMPDAIDQAARRSRLLEVYPRELAVHDFLRARLTHIGDPLYGDLRKLNTLFDTRVALIPVGAVRVPEPGGSDRVHMAVALIDSFGGNVLWYGVVAGDEAGPDAAAALASTAQALAKLITR